MLACCKPCYAKTTARIPTAVMIFFACFISYAVRLSLNIAIMAMVFPQNLQKGGGDCNPDPPEKSNVTKEPPDYGPRNDWSTAVQGHVKAAYGYGYFVAHFPAGVLAELAGPRLVMVAAAVAMGVLTALLPLAAGLHWGAVFALRVVAGVAGGIVYPCMHALVAQWSPPHEKGKFMFALMGGSFSSVVTMPVAGFITETLGWPAVFYVTSAGCGFFCLVWLLTVFDSPALHPAISDEERDFILESLGDAVKVKKPPVPLKRVLASAPSWGLVILHYGNLWGLFLLTTDTPIFLHEVLGFSIKESGGINSLPTLGRCIMSLISGSIVDVIVTKQLWKNKGTMRKFFVLFSHIVPGALMLGLAFVGCNVPGAIALLTIGLSFNGASTVTNLVNHHDLAPNYAGSLYGFMNGIGTTTLFIVPSLDGLLLENNNGLTEWRYIFLIGCGFYLVTGLIFFFLGSGETQSWNDLQDNPNQQETKQ